MNFFVVSKSEFKRFEQFLSFHILKEMFHFMCIMTVICNFFLWKHRASYFVQWIRFLFCAQSMMRSHSYCSLLFLIEIAASVSPANCFLTWTSNLEYCCNHVAEIYQVGTFIKLLVIRCFSSFNQVCIVCFLVRLPYSVLSLSIYIVDDFSSCSVSFFFAFFPSIHFSYSF